MLLNAESTCKVPGTGSAARSSSGLLTYLGRVLAWDVGRYVPLLQQVPGSMHVNLLILYFTAISSALHCQCSIPPILGCILSVG